MNDYDNIPAELRKLNQWVCTWDGSKVPMNAYGYEGASSSDSSTWAEFEQAAGCVEQGYYDHIGFVFSKENGYVGIDIDTGFEDGLLTPLCVDIIKHTNSYTEKSKSGRGVHIFLKGVLPFSGKNNQNGVEIYCEKRYFITTGKVILGLTEIQDNQEGIDYVLNHYFSDNLVKNSREVSNLNAEHSKFQRYTNNTKIYTPAWKKPQNGRFALNPEYPEIKKGNRNVSMLSLAGQLWSTGYEIKDIYKHLCEVNRKQCKPPLKESELERICMSISKYER